MTRILFFLLFLMLFVACVSPGGCDTSGCAAGNYKADASSQQINCRVLEFYFCDARPDVKRRIMIGPFRLLGIAEEYTCSLLLPPFGSSTNSLAPFYADGNIDASVAMYSDKIGFFVQHSPCWRLRVIIPASANAENIILEVNYSYCYDDGASSGYVKAMQRLPLRAMDATACRVGRGVNGAVLCRNYSDESVPFSIICLGFTLKEENFYPL